MFSSGHVTESTWNLNPFSGKKSYQNFPIQLPPSCELGLTSADKGVISAVMFLGMLVGGYIWGSLGDMYGRRKTLIVAMVVNFACGLASSFAGTKNSFVVWRFLSGLGVGGSIPLVWDGFTSQVDLI